MKRSGSSSLRLSPTGSPSRWLSPTGSPSHRLSSSPFNRSSEATSASHARDWVPPRDSQHFAHMFTKALWGHIHGTLTCRRRALTPPTSTRSRSSAVCQESVVARRRISSLLYRRRLESLCLQLPFLQVSLTPTPTLTPKLTQTCLRTISTATSLRSPRAMLCVSSDSSTARTGALSAPTLCTGGAS
jgi:hypothetical protein